MDYDLRSIIKNFKIEGTFLDAQPYGSGHIHDTFLIRTAEEAADDYLLQRINHYVFKNVNQLMSNIEKVTKHIQKKIKPSSERKAARECLTFIPTKEERYCFQDSGGNYWRVSVFIANSHSYDLVESPEKAHAGGRAFGNFLALLADFSPDSLYETIPDFHNVEKRLDKFYETVKRDPAQRVREVSREIEFVRSREEEMKCIIRLGREGKIPKRVTHNDTKFNNILFDDAGRVLCVTDLDTVMPGYIHYDFGDAIRTTTNTGAEDEKDLSRVAMDLRLFEAFSRGFLEEMRAFLNETEIEYLAFSGKLLAFTIGLRFLTDFIDGDKYFKIHHQGHNLQRAKAQFKLLESMEEQYEAMKAIIKEIELKRLKNGGD